MQLDDKTRPNDAQRQQLRLYEAALAVLVIPGFMSVMEVEQVIAWLHQQAKAEDSIDAIKDAPKALDCLCHALYWAAETK